MPNEIGWGYPVDFANGYGAAAANAEDGYGSVVINSYSGESDASGIDADNRAARLYLIGTPLIYTDADTMYLYYEYNPNFEPIMNVRVTVYKDTLELDTKSYTEDGIQILIEEQLTGEYYVMLEVYIDTITYQEYTSNTINA